MVRVIVPRYVQDDPSLTEYWFLVELDAARHLGRYRWCRYSDAAPVAAATGLPMAGAGSASAPVNDVQAQGFNVAINYLQGRPNVPLTKCRVHAITKPSAPTAVPSTVTVYVDVLCPNAK